MFGRAAGNPLNSSLAVARDGFEPGLAVPLCSSGHRSLPAIGRRPSIPDARTQVRARPSSFYSSGRRESNPVSTHPKRMYYRYTTARCYHSNHQPTPLQHTHNISAHQSRGAQALCGIILRPEIVSSDITLPQERAQRKRARITTHLRATNIILIAPPTMRVLFLARAPKDRKINQPPQPLLPAASTRPHVVPMIRPT